MLITQVLLENDIISMYVFPIPYALAVSEPMLLMTTPPGRDPDEGVR
jgi:hypothetical protein